jgi:Lipopolysaccharide-assembly
MKAFKKIALYLVPCAVCLAALINNSSCHIYKFKDISIPDTIRTVKVNFLENRARYVNPQLSPRLSDKIRQKIVSQTRLSQTNGDNADWEISGYISDYTLTTSAISGQKEAGNRLTVGVHISLNDHKADKITEYDISRPFEFGATQSLQQAEAALADKIIRDLTDDIFNRIFSTW